MKTKKKLIIATVAVILGAGLLATGGYFIAKKINKPEQGQVQPAPDTPNKPGDETPLTHEVKLVVDGEETTQTVATGGLVVLPEEDPTKEGHTFLGYAKEGTEELVDFTTYTINENTTFVAVFEKNTYQVKFVVNGEETTQSVKYQEFAVLPEEPTKLGYKFVGYTVDGMTVVVDASVYPITQDTTFVEKFELATTSATLFTIYGNRIQSYNGTETDIIVPVSYSLDENGNVIDGDDIPITEMFATFFSKNKVTSVKILENITSISGSMFSNCSSLTEVELPEGITSIPDSAFSYCSKLEKIDIPSTVTSIGKKAFESCRALTELYLHDNITSIGKEAFQICQGLTTVRLPAGLTKIEDSVFSACNNLANIEIPEGVTSIGNSAFNGCKLTEITVPNAVTSIGSYAFSGNYISEIIIPEGVTSIGNNAFASCSRLTKVVLPEGLTTISESMLSSCYQLAEVNIPSSVTSIGNSAFYKCQKLTSISLPNTLTSIGSQAFEGCTALDCAVTINETVTSIGANAFKDCTGLTVNFLSEPKGVDTTAISTVEAIYVPAEYYDALIAGEWASFADKVHVAE